MALKGLEEWELHEEIFWKKKSRINWLQEGDRNTAFFHNSVKAWRQVNSLSSLIRPEGMHLSSIVEISRSVVKYFSTLFSNEELDARAEEKEILGCIPHLVSVEMNEALLCPILQSKVEKVVFNMNKGKALGHNGFFIKLF